MGDSGTQLDEPVSEGPVQFGLSVFENFSSLPGRWLHLLNSAALAARGAAVNQQDWPPASDLGTATYPV